MEMVMVFLSRQDIGKIITKLEGQLCSEREKNRSKSFASAVYGFPKQFYVIQPLLFLKLSSKAIIIENLMPLVHRSNHPPHQQPKQSVKIQQNYSQASPSQEQHSPIKQEDQEGNEGRWDDTENLKFAVFIAYYQEIFASRHKRKHSKIFKCLANYLGERTAPQCRSHFQKLLIKHKTPAKIKKYYRGIYGEHMFDAELANFKQEWEQNHFSFGNSIPRVRTFRDAATQTEEIMVKEEERMVMYHPLGWSIVKMEDLSQWQYHPFS